MADETRKTVISSFVNFADASTFLKYRDWRHIGDLLNDDDTRPTQADTQNHILVTLALETATAMIEQAVYRGGRYTRADLKHLSDTYPDPENNNTPALVVGRRMLQQLCCDLAFWVLLKRRKPDIDPMRISGVREALLTLESLRLGEAVFPFQEVADAADTDIAPLDPNVSKASYRYEPLSQTSLRLFGVRSRSLRN